MPLTDLLDELQNALAGHYRVERELGGGGMSRVFLAEETALGRLVVLKALPPEFAAVLSADRFQREVRISAGLQHPHIVPLLSAGRVNDILYYTMPFVQGESLRARLLRERELPVGEAARLLREVADALHYAHEQGVVHRDIKPDNILLSHGHAVVTDFGIAKALTEAGGGGSLTGTGMSVGTPAYMAPEQATGDPVDARADLYALGVVAYEMLAGEPPFRGATAQALIGAQLTRTASPVSELRPSVPAGLAAVIHRCLEKRPADRFQSASELLATLDAEPPVPLSPTPVSVPARPRARGAAPGRTAREWPVGTVLGIFAAAGALLLALAWWLRTLAGLPDWFFGAAVVLLALGLPVVLLAAQLHNRRLAGRTTPNLPLPTAIHRRLTVRSALWGGVAAFSTLGLVTGGYMGMRALGIGPVGTLVAAGKLKERERLVIADFANQTRDPMLGPAVTQAFRIDFAQSRLVSPVEHDYLRRVLRLMQRPDSAELTLEVAREIAQREGFKAIVAGGIQQVGASLLVTAQVVSAESGEVLATARRTARDSTAILEAIDHVSKSLREDIGESLRSLRANAPLEQVTTGSLDALRKYSQAVMAENQNDNAKGIALLEEAVGADSGFAMAWRKLGTMLANEGERTGDAVAAITRAWRFRDRLTFRERKLTESSYWSDVVGDQDSSAAALESLLREYPDDSWATNNLGVVYSSTGAPEKSEQMFARSVVLEPENLLSARNLWNTRLRLGKFDSASAALERVRRMAPPSSQLDELDIVHDLGRREFVAAEAKLREQLTRYRSDSRARLSLTRMLAGVLLIRGKLAEADRMLLESADLRSARGFEGHALVERVRRATPYATYLGDTATTRRIVSETLRERPLEGLPERERPLSHLLLIAYEIGDHALMERLYREFERNPGDLPGRGRPFLLSMSRAMLLSLRKETLPEAIAESRRIPGACDYCIAIGMAQAFDRMGMPDSALAHYETWAAMGENLWWLEVYFTRQPLTYFRMAELYETRGDRARAIDYYGRFTELWRDADPELQPQVRTARRRLADLVAEPKL